jgi:hypothetical protein
MKLNFAVAVCFASVVLCLAPACKNPVRELERKTILKRMWSLASFSGVYTETGIGSKPQSTKILWRAEPPAVLATAINNGDVLHYASGTLSTYYPKTAFGIRYRNLTELKAADQMLWIENEYDWHVAHYDINQLEDSAVAGFSTTGVRYFPNAEFSASPFSFEWRAAVEADYAFALETAMYKAGTEKYRIRFDRMEFQKHLHDTDFAFRYPPGTTIAEYDFADKPVTLAGAQASANFRFALPPGNEQFVLKKIIRAKGIIPAFTAYFEKLPYQTYYTQVRDYGLKLVPERGLVLTGVKGKRALPRSYHVNFAGAFRSVWFLEKGVYHTTVTSMPLSEVLEWLDK